jgi:hypothetical protein
LGWGVGGGGAARRRSRTSAGAGCGIGSLSRRRGAARVSLSGSAKRVHTEPPGGECAVEVQADGFVGSRVHAARLPIARLAHIGQGAGIRALSSGRAVGPLHGSRELDPRGDVEFAEDVAQVRLDRLEAEEQLGGDLGVRLAVDD